jgi:ribosome maturation factor RimP
MSVTDVVRDIVLPILSDQDVELYDLDVQGSVVKVVVDRKGGVDLEALGAVTRAVSRALDDADPIPSRYTLEVTSPGVERPLRTPDQFARAIGEVVKVRTLPEAPGDRRVEGVLATADEAGITVRSTDPEESDEPVLRRLAYAEIERARTVFEWGTPAPKPGQNATSPGGKKQKRERRS